MKIGAMNHPARNPLEEIDWFGRHGFDFVDFTLEPPAADPDQIDPEVPCEPPWTATASASWRTRPGSFPSAPPSPASGRRAWASSGGRCGPHTRSVRRS